MHCEPRQEGYEFDLFDELLGGDYNLLPEQISFELHLITQFPSQPWFHRQKTIGEQPGTGPVVVKPGYCISPIKEPL